MSEPGFASLGPTLLARKGGAKPAMRPQLPPLVQDEAQLAAIAEEQLEDLGWNDMGGEDAGHAEGGANIVPINAAVAAEEFAESNGPIVRRQQRRLAERVLADAVMTGPEDGEPEYDAESEDDGAFADAAEPLVAPAPEPIINAVSPRMTQRKPRTPTAKPARRAAFTLRLDPERHLKLRLAATMQGVSAQALMTDALDALLAEFDDLDVIASHLKRH